MTPFMAVLCLFVLVLIVAYVVSDAGDYAEYEYDDEDRDPLE